jgi:Glycosyltransferases involved in cell wall biogenesis
VSAKISIVVPVYNVQNYLHDCINSIVQQSYQNIEIILIDDGSSDGSGDICDICAEKDNRIKVIHKKNEGVSVARNRGLELASGEYIGFVDGDDVIHKDMYTILLEAIYQREADIVICRFAKLYLNGETSNAEEPLKFGVLDKSSIFDNLILPMCGSTLNALSCPPIMGSNCRCLYRKSTIDENNIKFEKVRIAEDMLFQLNYLGQCNTAVVLENVLYFYRYNPTSATNRYITNLWETLNTQQSLVENTLKNLNLYNAKSLERLQAAWLYFMCWCITNEAHKGNNKSYKEIIKTMKKYSIDKKTKEVLVWRNIANIPFKERCIFTSIKLQLYCLIYTYLRIK